MCATSQSIIFLVQGLEKTCFDSVAEDLNELQSRSDGHHSVAISNRLNAKEGTPDIIDLR